MAAISHFPFVSFSLSFLLCCDTLYRRQCPFEWQREKKKKKKTFNVVRKRKKRFPFLFDQFLCPVNIKKIIIIRNVISIEATRKRYRRPLLFCFFFTIERDFRCVCVKVLSALRCFVIICCGSKEKKKGGRGRINRRRDLKPFMNGRCGLLSHRGWKQTRFSRAFELIKLFSFEMKRRVLKNGNNKKKNGGGGGEKEITINKHGPSERGWWQATSQSGSTTPPQCL